MPISSEAAPRMFITEGIIPLSAFSDKWLGPMPNRQANGT